MAHPSLRIIESCHSVTVPAFGGTLRLGRYRCTRGTVRCHVAVVGGPGPLADSLYLYHDDFTLSDKVWSGNQCGVNILGVIVLDNTVSSHYADRSVSADDTSVVIM